MVKMNGQELWDTIKNKNIDVYAIVKKVSDYCEFIAIDPNKCYLTTKASAVLPALEAALGDEYICSTVEKYILVEKKPTLIQEQVALKKVKAKTVNK